LLMDKFVPARTVLENSLGKYALGWRLRQHSLFGECYAICIAKRRAPAFVD
jgi:hypothetical protein